MNARYDDVGGGPASSMEPSVGLTVREARDDRTVVLELGGELDIASVKVVRDALERAERESPERVIIDLCGLGFIDSAGIHLLVGAYQRMARRGGPRLELRPGSRAVQRVFQLTGLEEVLPFVSR